MVVLGIDVHKDTHTAVAVDEVGRQRGQRLVRATDAGHRQLVRWARSQWPGGPGELDVPARGLDRLVVLDRLLAWAGAQPPSMVVRLVGELLADIRAATVRINTLEREIAERVAQVAPALLGLPGCGSLTAAKIVGETANPARFRSEACFAMHAGVAPIPASSGRTQRYRLARGGNRQLNAALHRIAVTQIRLPDSLGQVYYQRRRAQGDTTMEALRVLKRRLARVVFTLLQPATTSATGNLPAAA